RLFQLDRPAGDAAAARRGRRPARAHAARRALWRRGDAVPAGLAARGRAPVVRAHAGRGRDTRPGGSPMTRPARRSLTLVLLIAALTLPVAGHAQKSL